MSFKTSQVRALCTEEVLAAPVDALASGYSQRAAAKQSRVPRKTLRNHLKSGSKTKEMGRPSILTRDQEEELTQKFVRHSEVVLPIKIFVLRSYVCEFCSKNNIQNQFNSEKQSAGQY